MFKIVQGIVWLAIMAVAWGQAPSIVAAESPSSPSIDAILGVWATEGADSKVEISRSGAIYVGKVVWLGEAEREGVPVQDANNTNPALRSRPIMGLEILTGFARGPAGGWQGGRSTRRDKGAVTQQRWP